ncbi:MAG: hypothetical protein P4L42_02025 [Desulfocapsaceae bacterium]|nr:hypothetical protein [Desulfocapsaceae bacterium]
MLHVETQRSMSTTFYFKLTGCFQAGDPHLKEELPAGKNEGGKVLRVRGGNTGDGYKNSL